MMIIVVGAGPGGAAAARALAAGGATVRLVERSAWPRAKTCGDGISPTGVGELRAAGFAVDTLPGLRLHEGIISSPSGASFTGGWAPQTPWGTIIPRREFDALLVDAATRAGATFEPETTVRAIDLSTGKPRVTIESREGARETVMADAVVIAEGATGALAQGLGFGKHRSRLVAIRGYSNAPQPLAPRFGLFFDASVVPGYGWVFPVNERRANVGIVTDERDTKSREGDLRHRVAHWATTSDFAVDALGPDAVLEEVHGGIVPTGRRRRAMPGVFLVGDAAGVADPFSAEGIFQAMRSGRLVAEALLTANGDPAKAARRYEKSLVIFDRNEREARRLRMFFTYVIEPMTKRAAQRPKLAHHLSSSGFFLKESLPAFLWGIVRHW